MVNIADYQPNTINGSDPKSIEGRCIRSVKRKPGITLGVLLKFLERKRVITRQNALEAIQNTVDRGDVKTTEHEHPRSQKTFLRFWPVE